MRFNLQIKLLSLVVMVVSFVLIILLLQTVSRERQIFQAGFRDKAVILALALDAGIGSPEELKDTAKLQSNIYKFIWLYPEIVQISISAPSSEGLKIVSSNATEEIGTLSGIENNIAYKQGKVLTKTLLLPDNTKVFSAIAPIRVGGQKVGTYDIRLSLETEEETIAQRQKEVVLTILATIVIIITILFLLLSKMVILPIAEIKKGLEMIGQGQLSWRITPRSQDEIGDLAKGVNGMSEKLEESYRGLGKKVEERTKELQEKMKEVERFNRLAVGRELKMIELKQEIRRLQKELEKKS